MFPKLCKLLHACRSVVTGHMCTHSHTAMATTTPQLRQWKHSSDKMHVARSCSTADIWHPVQLGVYRKQNCYCRISAVGYSLRKQTFWLIYEILGAGIFPTNRRQEQIKSVFILRCRQSSSWYQCKAIILVGVLLSNSDRMKFHHKACTCHLQGTSCPHGAQR